MLTRIVPHIPLKPSHSDATCCSSACQAHKVATTNVAGKQRRTNLLKEHIWINVKRCKSNKTNKIIIKIKQDN